MKKSTKKNILLYFRAFVLSTLCIVCVLLLVTGMFYADNNIRLKVEGESKPVFNSEQIKGGYNIEIFGIKTTMGGEWVYKVYEAASYAAVLLPPPIRIVTEFFSAENKSDGTS